MPKIESTQPVFDTRNGNLGYVLTGSTLTTPFSLTFMLLTTLKVVNNMRPDVPISSISVTSFRWSFRCLICLHQGNFVKAGSDLPKFYGTGIIQNLWFKSGAEKTFNATFNLTYTTYMNGVGIVSDEAFSYLITSCGLLGGIRSDLKFKYTAVVDCPWISWIGIKPQISDTVTMACPFQTSVILDVLRAIGVVIP
ncbi:hypothetical protein HK098_000357 [Nowakowskiella sp. JEL0407]|nr:hypothetical protein HK098_000357 [Nowakowskiella sp. JEL0407]